MVGSGSNSAIFSALMYWAGQRLAHGSDSAGIHHLQGEARRWIAQRRNWQNPKMTKKKKFLSAICSSQCLVFMATFRFLRQYLPPNPGAFIACGLLTVKHVGTPVETLWLHYSCWINKIFKEIISDTLEELKKVQWSNLNFVSFISQQVLDFQLHCCPVSPRSIHIS